MTTIPHRRGVRRIHANRVDPVDLGHEIDAKSYKCDTHGTGR